MKQLASDTSLSSIVMAEFTDADCVEIGVVSFAEILNCDEIIAVCVKGCWY